VSERTVSIREAISKAIVGILLGEKLSVQSLQEAEVTAADIKADVKAEVKRSIKELDDKVLKMIAKELKTDKFEEIVTKIVANALAKYHEILWTRKSTWNKFLSK
jgi:hypothetical protein